MDWIVSKIWSHYSDWARKTQTYFHKRNGLIYQVNLSIYVDNFYIKLLAIGTTFIATLFLFLFSLSTAQIQKWAHSWYNLYLIIAKWKPIPSAKNMKIVDLISRLAGPKIAIYCYDFFILDNYEFYLFIVRISSNLFLLMSLIVWS